MKLTEQELQGIALVMEILMSTGGGWQDQHVDYVMKLKLLLQNLLLIKY